eukprot:2371148-Rhodomonas_salina.6
MCVGNSGGCTWLQLASSAHTGTHFPPPASAFWYSTVAQRSVSRGVFRNHEYRARPSTRVGR